MKNFVYTACLTLHLTACAPMKHPAVSGNPRTMSADTLCYRHAARPGDEGLAAEVAVRGLDCAAILEDDPLYRPAR